MNPTPFSVSALKEIDYCHFKNTSLGSKLFAKTDNNGMFTYEFETKTSRTLPLAPNAQCAVHPSRQIVALRNEDSFQIFDLQLKAKLKGASWPSDLKQEEKSVRFWKWVDDNTLIVVTDRSVHKVHLHGADETFQRVFDVNEDSGKMITNVFYHQGENGEDFYLVTGLVPAPPSADPICQLYSVKRNVSQTIRAAACFTTVCKGGEDIPAMAMVMKQEETFKFSLISLPGSNQHVRVMQEFPTLASGDIIVCVVPMPRFECVAVITKKGLIMLFQCESGRLLYKGEDFVGRIVFLTTPLEDGNGFLAVTNNSILQVCIDDLQMLQFLSGHELSATISSRILSKGPTSTTPYSPSAETTPYRVRESITTTSVRSSKEQELESLIVKALELVKTNHHSFADAGIIMGKLQDIVDLLAPAPTMPVAPSAPTVEVEPQECFMEPVNITPLSQILGPPASTPFDDVHQLCLEQPLTPPSNAPNLEDFF